MLHNIRSMSSKLKSMQLIRSDLFGKSNFNFDKFSKIIHFQILNQNASIFKILSTNSFNWGKK